MLTPEQITALVEAIRDGTYTIEDAFEDIATGQYGEDVRKAMYAGLLTCYHDGKNDMRYLSVNQSSMQETYGSLLENLPPQTVAYVNASWVEDAPFTSGIFWIYTYATLKTTDDKFAIQIAYRVSDGRNCIRIKPAGEPWNDWQVNVPSEALLQRGNVTSVYGADADADDIVSDGLWYIPNPNSITNLPFAESRPAQMLVVKNNTVTTQILVSMWDGVTYLRYKVGENAWGAWAAGDKHDVTARYIAFGDSTTYGQVAVAGNRSVNNYPAVVGRALSMVVDNKGVKWQGLLKDWDTIYDTVTSLDYTGVKLITVGWAYNDSEQFLNFPLGTYSDDDEDETIIGKYFTIMDEIQLRAPTATVILVTGYGIKGNFRSAINCADGDHTYEEFYEELEKMCNFRGWCCVNQAKGCWVNHRTSDTLIGDNVHPTEDGYKVYGNYMAARIASLFANIKMD